MRGASTTVRMIYSRAAASGPYCARAGADDARETAKRLASGTGAPMALCFRATSPLRARRKLAIAIREPENMGSDLRSETPAEMMGINW